MKLTVNLAKDVINRVNQSVDVPINLMDETGTILASSDVSRIGEHHTGAKQALLEQKTIVIKHNDKSLYPNTRPGVNIPIMFHKDIVGVVGVTGNPEEVYQLANMTRLTIEMIIEQMTIERENYVQERRLRDWFNKLVHPLGYDEEQLKQDTDFINEIEAEDRHQVIIITSEHTAFDIDYIRLILDRYLPNYQFVLTLNQLEIIVSYPEVITPKEAKQLMSSLPANSIYIGSNSYGLEGMRQSYLFAKEVWQMKNNSQWSQQNGVYTVDDWRFTFIARSVSSNVLTAFEAEYEKLMALTDEYKETIFQYYKADFQVNETARQLHIHRNTLNYRLDMITNKTGLNPKKVSEALTIYLLLLRIQFGQLHN